MIIINSDYGLYIIHSDEMDYYQLKVMKWMIAQAFPTKKSPWSWALSWRSASNKPSRQHASACVSMRPPSWGHGKPELPPWQENVRGGEAPGDGDMVGMVATNRHDGACQK